MIYIYYILYIVYILYIIYKLTNLWREFYTRNGINVTIIIKKFWVLTKRKIERKERSVDFYECGSGGGGGVFVILL